jgi:hypothetical protein
MPELDDLDHVFRHLKMTWVQDDFVDPDAFRRRPEDVNGISVDWVEYFGQATPRDAVTHVRAAHLAKGRRVGGQSKYGLLNVGKTKAGLLGHCALSFFNPQDPNDPSHSFIDGTAVDDDIAAELIGRTIIDVFPAVGNGP